MSLKVFLFVIRVPRSQSSALEAAGADYLARCGAAFAAEGRVMRTEAALLAAVAEERRRGATAFWIADPGGQTLTTEQFASRIRQARDGGLRQLILAIGPADGWSVAARTAAELRLSLGAMTLPHELAALVLAEQVYRVSTILQGHPYHLGH
jgi:23S rRNA (pseudouridine1915-N3)-methyltransferase